MRPVCRLLLYPVKFQDRKYFDAFVYDEVCELYYITDEKHKGKYNYGEVKGMKEFF